MNNKAKSMISSLPFQLSGQSSGPLSRLIPVALSLFLLHCEALAWAASSSENTDTKTHAECAEEAHFPQISKAELKKVAAEQSATIIDVNSAASFKKVHVPGAIHFGSHRKDFASILPKTKDQLIVAYCGGAQCSAWHQAAEEACQLGYTNVRHFKEGIQGWTAKN